MSNALWMKMKEKNCDFIKDKRMRKVEILLLFSQQRKGYLFSQGKRCHTFKGFSFKIKGDMLLIHFLSWWKAVFWAFHHERECINDISGEKILWKYDTFSPARKGSLFFVVKRKVKL